MAEPPVSFHNVAELRTVEEYDGRVLQRLPEAVRVELNDAARTNYRRPAGSEIRAVPDGEGTVYLSAPDRPCEVRQFWGPFQGARTRIGADPTPVNVALPPRLADLRDEVAADLAFDPAVCRLVMPHDSTAVCYHGADGGLRPPADEELPERRYVAYGTSITRGIAATGPHLTFVEQVAQQTGMDAINLGSGGSAFCEPAIADHVAGRDDWDVATLSLSVNMVAGFAPAEFERRASYMIDTVAGSNPDRSVVAVTLFPYFPDVCTDPDGHENFERFRGVLRDVVASADHDNVHLAEGPTLLDDVGGLAADLLHPGDRGMRDIAAGLATRLDALTG